MMASLGEHQDERFRRWRGSPSRLGKLDNDSVDRQTVAGFSVDLFHGSVAFGPQHVFHLHGLNDSERLAGLDLLSLHDRDGKDETGHRATHGLGAVSKLLCGHAPGDRGLGFSVNAGLDLHAEIGKLKAVKRWPQLHRDRMSIESAGPQRITRLPLRLKYNELAVSGADKASRERAIVTLNLQRNFDVAETYHTPPLGLERIVRPLAANAALALRDDMIGGGRNRRK